MSQPDPLVQPADLVLRRGVVHTMDDAPQERPAESLAIRDGRVLRVGDDDDVVATAGPNTRVVDLQGRAVIPGINDAHLHATWLGSVRPRTELGFGHAPAVAPLCSADDRRAAVLHAADLLASLGITSYTEPGIGPGEDDGPTGAFGSAVADTYRDLAGEGLLKARVTALALFGVLDGPSDVDSFLAGLATLDTSTPDPSRLRFAGVKIFADGIPPMHTAYTRAPYVGGDTASLLVEGGSDAQREANFAKMLVAAHSAGLQIGVHATGDRAVDLMLDALEGAGDIERTRDLGHYVIHGDLVDHSQLERMARAGIGMSVQAGIAVHTCGMVEPEIGAARAAHAWPLQDALDTGVHMCLTSDSPILSPDWRRQVAAADDWLGRADDVRARMAALLRCYTVTPAHQDGAGSWKGRLLPGMAADICVLGADPMRVTPAELPEVDVDLTITAGAIVHDRSQVSS